MTNYTINHKKGKLAQNVGLIATPASATAEVIAEKVNELIQVLIDSKQIKA